MTDPDRPPTSKSRACDALVRILTPHLGETMARASVDRHVQKLGLSQDNLGPSDLQPLIERLAQGLNVFLGRPQTVQVVEQMQRAALEDQQP